MNYDNLAHVILSWEEGIGNGIGKVSSHGKLLNKWSWAFGEKGRNPTPQVFLVERKEVWTEGDKT